MIKSIKMKNCATYSSECELIENCQKINFFYGPNGSGKSTILKMVNDLLTIDQGEILINGKHIGVESKSMISYLPERTYLESGQTVKTNRDIFTERKKAFIIRDPNTFRSTSIW